MANISISSADPSITIIEFARRQTIRFAVALGVVNLLLPPSLILYASLSGEYYATLFWGEGNVVTWFSNVQLLLIAGVAYANHESATLLSRLKGPQTKTNNWIWLIFASAFVFLAADEILQIHEALREHLFQANALFGNIAFLRSGDFGLYLYLAVGLFFTLFLIGELRGHRWSLALFLAALGLTASTIIVDTLSPEIIDEVSNRKFLTSVFEEVGELWAQLLFLLSFLAVLRGRLGQLTPEQAA